MGTLYYLVGLPGSGKSTFAKEGCPSNVSIHSSDAIRKEIFGSEFFSGDQSKVFDILNERIIKDLKAGKDTVYDSTGISSKRRIVFLKMINRIDCKKVCIFMATPYEICLERNRNRERTVPEDVIKRMYKSIDIPYYHEGWDDINIIWSGLKKFGVDHTEYPKVYNNYDQHNPYHTLTLGKHMEKGASICDDMNFNIYVYDAIKLHDIGKPFCATYVDAKGQTQDYCHYYGHASVSAYESLFILKTNFNFWYYTDDPYILRVCTLINLHMRPYAWKTEKTKEKYRNILGEDLFEDLMNLNYCDKKAH